MARRWYHWPTNARRVSSLQDIHNNICLPAFPFPRRELNKRPPCPPSRPAPVLEPVGGRLLLPWADELHYHVLALRTPTKKKSLVRSSPFWRTGTAPLNLPPPMAGINWGLSGRCSFFSFVREAAQRPRTSGGASGIDVTCALGPQSGERI